MTSDHAAKDKQVIAGTAEAAAVLLGPKGPRVKAKAAGKVAPMAKVAGADGVDGVIEAAGTADLPGPSRR